MQLSILEVIEDQMPSYDGKRVMIGLSGGINSAAVLCYLAKFIENKPNELFLFHANFVEHSPDTLEFVRSCVDYARANFASVHYTQTDNSILKHFEEQGTIYHPMFSGCTRMLKIEPMVMFMKENQIDVDLVGYIRGEYKRIKRQVDKGVLGKEYLISHLSDDDCFSLVEQEIGWYPEIYRLLWNDPRILEYINTHGHELAPEQLRVVEKYAKQGHGFGGTRRVFKHNNCLPCKNMHPWELWIVRLFYPDYYERAMALAAKINSYWGRDREGDPESDTTCGMCAI